MLISDDGRNDDFEKKETGIELTDDELEAVTGGILRTMSIFVLF